MAAKPLRTVVETALDELLDELGWPETRHEVGAVEIWQVPLPTDPDIVGLAILFDTDARTLSTYAMLGREAPPHRRREGAVFAAAAGHGARFGAVEYDISDGSLRIRVDAELEIRTAPEAVRRCVDRALTLARQHGQRWRAFTLDETAS